MYRGDLTHGIHGDEALEAVLCFRRFPFHLDTLGFESHAKTDVQRLNYGLVDKSSIDRELQSVRFMP